MGGLKDLVKRSRLASKGLVDYLEIEAAKQAGKYSNLKIPLDNALAKIKFGVNYLTATGRTYFDGLVNKINLTITNGAYKKGAQTIAHLQNEELVIDATGDATTLGSNATLLEYAEDISFKKTNTGGMVSEDVLIFDDNGTIKCLYGNNCFVKNTLVKTKQGLKVIQDVTIQDSVLSFNEEKKLSTYNKVKVLFKKNVSKLQRIIVGTDTIVCTPDHRFFSGGKWLKAAALTIGSLLHLNTAATLPITSNIAFDSSAVVYNFEVENNHNYYIGKQSILVHNDCKVVTQLLNDGKLTKAQADDFLKDFAANQTLLAKFGNGELDVEAWKIIFANPQIRKDFDVLNAITELIKSNKIASTDITNIVDKLATLGLKCKTCSSGNNTWKFIDEILDDINYIANNYPNSNFNNVLSDIKKGGGFTEGAIYTTDIVKRFSGEFPPMQTTFEVVEDIPGNIGSRRVDIVVDGLKNTFYELKSVATLPPANFGKQFIKDLVNPTVTDLSQLKWYFDSKKLSSLNQTALMNAFEAELNLLDQPALNLLYNRFLSNSPTQDISAMKLLITNNFNVIFKLK